MKKLLAIICVIMLVFVLVGCGNTEDTSNKTSSTQTDSSKKRIVDETEDDIEKPKELPVLKNDDEYVVVGRVGDAKLTSLKDLAGKKVGFIYDTDSELIAQYYAGTALGFNADHDAYSGMNDKTKLDYIIVSKIGAESRTGGSTNYIVVLDNLVIE